jgi:hypothetical protein
MSGRCIVTLRLQMVEGKFPIRMENRMLSRLAQEFADEIKLHDWSDAHSRFDRAGHQHEDDAVGRRAAQLSPDEARKVHANAMLVAAQVLAHADHNFRIKEFATACGVNLSEGTLKAALRMDEGRPAAPGVRT